jgi:hypothetical protein
MSVLLVKTAEPKIQSRAKPALHRLMACACSVVLLATLRDAVLGGIAVAANSMAVARAYVNRRGANAFS